MIGKPDTTHPHVTAVSLLKCLCCPHIANFVRQDADHIHFSSDLVEKPILIAALLRKVEVSFGQEFEARFRMQTGRREHGDWKMKFEVACAAFIFQSTLFNLRAEVYAPRHRSSACPRKSPKALRK